MDIRQAITILEAFNRGPWQGGVEQENAALFEGRASKFAIRDLALSGNSVLWSFRDLKNGRWSRTKGSVIVMPTSQDGEIALADGYHRVVAAILRGDTHIMGRFNPSVSRMYSGPSARDRWTYDPTSPTRGLDTLGIPVAYIERMAAVAKNATTAVTEGEGDPSSPLNLPHTLYHATFQPYLDSIERYGLGGVQGIANYDASQAGVVYLATSPEVAFSYAEVSEEVPEAYLDHIVVLSVAVDDLDRSKIKVDSNVRSDEPEYGCTFEYHGVIHDFDVVFESDESGTQIRKMVSENSLGKLYSHEGIEAVGYWYNPTNGRHATIAWEAADGVNTHSDHADYPWENPNLFGLTFAQVEAWGDTDVIRYGLTMKGWARIGYNTKAGMRVDAKTPSIARRAIRWFAQHHGMPHATSVTIVPSTIRGAFKHYNLKGEQVEEFVARGRLEPAWELTR